MSRTISQLQQNRAVHAKRRISVLCVWWCGLRCLNLQGDAERVVARDRGNFVTLSHFVAYRRSSPCPQRTSHLSASSLIQEEYSGCNGVQLRFNVRFFQNNGVFIKVDAIIILSVVTPHRASRHPTLLGKEEAESDGSPANIAGSNPTKPNNVCMDRVMAMELVFFHQR